MTSPMRMVRQTMARWLLDERMSDDEALGCVAYHPSITDRLAASPHPGELREKIARIISPDAFKTRDRHYGEIADLLSLDIAIQCVEESLASAPQEAEPVAWRDVKDVPQDGSPIILNHQAHGIIQGWFSKGEWTGDTPSSPREYTGDMWILGDDLAQDDVEFGENGEVLPGSVTSWLHLSEIQRLIVHPDDRGGEVKG